MSGEALEARQLLCCTTLRINAGGEEYTDTLGQVWSEDQYFENGFTYETDQLDEIDRTADDTLYLTERASGALSYAFPVENGAYTINLHFAELFWTDFGQRVFDISLEENTVEENVDVFARTKNAFNPGRGTAYISSYEILVGDGTLNLSMPASIDNAKVSAIEILPVDRVTMIATPLGSGATVVSEDGTPGSYNIRLSTQPTHPVAVSVVAGDGIRSEISSHEFNLTNWQDSKVVVVTAVDDQSASGTRSSFVRHLLSSEDPRYDAQVIDVPVIIEDDEAAFTTKTIAEVCNPTTVAWGPDGRLYIGSTTGEIHVLTVNDDYEVTARQTIQTIGSLPNKSILGIAFNPHDDSENPTIYVSHSQLYANGGQEFPLTQLSPYSGQVSTLGGPNFDQLNPLITGLPVSNHDHGVNGLAFGNVGDLYIAVGGNTNAGVVHTGLGGLDESPFSAAILKAEITKPDFNGAIEYELPDEPTGALEPPANLAFDPVDSQSWGGVACVSDGVDVSVYASGLRNPYDLVWTTSGLLYATDNSANSGFGEVSTGADSQEPFSTTRAWDELNLIEAGNYYGHPNRNRGKSDTRQNIYYDAHDASIAGIYTEEIAEIAPATGGIVEYRAATFDGELRGDLLVQRWNADVERIVLTEDGRTVQNKDTLGAGGGLDVTTAPGGVIVGVDYIGDTVTVAIPNSSSARTPVILDIFPWRANPGSRFVIGGEDFDAINDPTVVIGGIVAEIERVSPNRIEGIVPNFPAGANSGELLEVDIVFEAGTLNLPNAFLPLSGDTQITESVLRINAGGPEYVDAKGQSWLADQFFSGGYNYEDSEPISGTTDDVLYQSERFGNFSYSIPVANGTYEVELALAEIYFQETGERVFNIAAEGVQVAGPIDLIESMPRFAATTIVIEDIHVTDGSLDLQFESIVNNAKISAIHVTTGDSDEVPARLPGDADGNGLVDFFDYVTLAGNFGRSDPFVSVELGDFNEDGEVNFPDFLLLAQNFGRRLG